MLLSIKEIERSQGIRGADRSAHHGQCSWMSIAELQFGFPERVGVNTLTIAKIVQLLACARHCFSLLPYTTHVDVVGKTNESNIPYHQQKSRRRPPQTLLSFPVVSTCYSIPKYHCLVSSCLAEISVTVVAN